MEKYQKTMRPKINLCWRSNAISSGIGEHHKQFALTKFDAKNVAGKLEQFQVQPDFNETLSGLKFHFPANVTSHLKSRFVILVMRLLN